MKFPSGPQSTIDLNHIRIFAKVVEEGSFTAAAAALHITKSSISRALVHLEERVGVRLVQRNTRKVMLTTAGQAYFDQVRSALAELARASESVSEMGRQARGTVRLTAPPDVGSMLISKLTARFLCEYPNISVELSVTTEVVDLIKEGYDLAVRIGDLKDSSLAVRRIGHQTLGLFASKDYLERRGRPACPADLALHDCVLSKTIARHQGGRNLWRLWHDGREQAVEVTGRIEVNEMHCVCRSVLAGLGIGVLPQFYSRQFDGLVRILPGYALQKVPMSVVSPSRKLEPNRVVLFRDYLVTNLASELRDN
jgi:DNA-binding transcriptional LysR family regulator